MAIRETWATRVSEWKRIGPTAADYAERKGLKASTLTWWSSELGRAAAISQPPAVQVLVAQRSASALEVVQPSGVKIAMPVDFDEATLGRLLTLLEER